MEREGWVFNHRDRWGLSLSGWEHYLPRLLPGSCLRPLLPAASCRLQSVFKAPSLRPPHSAPLPCPPVVTLMSWLHRGLMGMPEPPASLLAAAEKLQRAGLQHQP